MPSPYCCLRVMLVLGPAFLSSSCIKKKPQSSQLQGNAEAGLQNVRWPKPEAVPVCWEKSENHQLRLFNGLPKPEIIEEFKRKVQDRAVQELSRAGVGLVGWGACQANSRGIRILLMNEATKVRAFGRNLDGMYGGILLGVPEPQDTGALTAAIHEFGHAFGLRHEHVRSEGPFYCEGEGGPVTNEVAAFALGKYDKNSIMSYCALDAKEEQSDESKAFFSEGDIAAIRGIHFGVIAELAQPLPETLGIDSYQSTVSGVEAYRFHYGPFDTTDCQDLSLYGPETSVQFPLSLSRSGMAAGPIKICVVGKTGGIWQKLELATQYFTRFSAAKAFADYQLPESKYLTGPTSLNLNTANSSPRLAAVFVKSNLISYNDDEFSNINCEDPVAYEALSDLNRLELPIPQDKKYDRMEVCILAKENSQDELDFKHANYHNFLVDNSYELLFAPLPRSKNVGSLTGGYTRDERLHLLLDGRNGMEKVSYWVGNGLVCGESGWQEAGPFDRIAIDQIALPGTGKDITFCVKSKKKDADWESYIQKWTWHQWVKYKHKYADFPTGRLSKSINNQNLVDEIRLDIDLPDGIAVPEVTFAEVSLADPKLLDNVQCTLGADGRSARCVKRVSLSPLATIIADMSVEGRPLPRIR